MQFRDTAQDRRSRVCSGESSFPGHQGADGSHVILPREGVVTWHFVTQKPGDFCAALASHTGENWIQEMCAVKIFSNVSEMIELVAANRLRRKKAQQKG